MKISSFLMAAGFLLLSSCVSITSLQKQDLIDHKIHNTYVEEKNPGLAAGLNVLPGIGDFYNGNIGYGVVNLLTWPLSILWAPVGGYDGAMVRNWEESRIFAARKALQPTPLLAPAPPAAPLAPATPEAPSKKKN